MPSYIAKSGDLDLLPMPYRLIHSLTTLKDSATQLLIKYKSGALATQKDSNVFTDKLWYLMVAIKCQ